MRPFASTLNLMTLGSSPPSVTDSLGAGGGSGKTAGWLAAEGVAGASCVAVGAPTLRAATGSGSSERKTSRPATMAAATIAAPRKRLPFFIDAMISDTGRYKKEAA